MTNIQKRLVGNYATLVMGKAMKIDEVPAKYKEWVELEITRREIEILESLEVVEEVVIEPTIETVVEEVV